MVKAVVRNYFSPDVAGRVEAWVPSTPGEVCYYLEMTIGPAGESGGDLFGVMVMSPEAEVEWDRTRGSRAGADAREGRRRLIVPEYSWERVVSEIERILARYQEEAWETLARRLARHFEWEFENYRG